MIRLLLLLPLAGCMSIDMGTPIAFTSACNGDMHCQRNLNAQTLHYLGHQHAATELMCADKYVQEVLDEECGNVLQ